MSGPCPSLCCARTRHQRYLCKVGSGCLDLVWVGCGRADAVYAGVAGEGWQPWDYAAGWLFAEEAGGVVSQVWTDQRDMYTTFLSAASSHLKIEMSSHEEPTHVVIDLPFTVANNSRRRGGQT